MVHGKLFWSLFEEEPSSFAKSHPDFLATGFARVKGEWKFNSITFNTSNPKWHNSDKGSNPIEIIELKNVLEAWINGGAQNQKVQAGHNPC